MPGFCLISTRFWKFHKINDLSEDIPNHKMNGIRGEKNAEKDHRPSHNYRKTASKKIKTSSATTHLTFNTGRPSVCPLVQFHPVPSGSRSNQHRRQAMPKKHTACISSAMTTWPAISMAIVLLFHPWL